MTNKHKTIDQCLDEAAREFDYKSYDDFNVLTTQLSYGAVKVYDKFIKRAMQIYADSCVSAKLEEVNAIANQFNLDGSIQHILDSGANEVRIKELVESFMHRAADRAIKGFKQEVREKLPSGEAMTEYSEEYHCATWPETNAFRDGLAFMKDQVKELLK